MPKKKVVEAEVKIGPRDFGSLLDMLRYDACTVTSWSGDGDSGFVVRLRSSPDRTPGYEYTEGRWASFGLTLRRI